MFKFAPKQGHSPDYIADHISRIEIKHGGNRKLILDSKWRIASHCDMPNLGDKLTPAQEKEVDQLIADFKVSHAKVIEKYKEVRSGH